MVLPINTYGPENGLKPSAGYEHLLAGGSLAPDAATGLQYAHGDVALGTSPAKRL